MELVFAGVPLGPIVSGIVQIVKSLFGEKADKYAVWVNLVVSVLAFAAVFAWQEGVVPADTQATAVLVLGILSTFFASAGTYDLVSNLKK